MSRQQLKDRQETARSFAEAVVTGLSASPKAIPARFFYDQQGSELFEAITTLPEYYPTRTEIAILRDHAREITRLIGRGRVVVEFGSGSSTKTPLLLSAVAPVAYVPIDISVDFLHEAIAKLTDAYPDLDILPLAGDFTKPLALPSHIAGKAMLGFFPGSTIGNLAPAAAVDLLRAFADTLGSDAYFVIGVDLKKNPEQLETAYNDATGVTAAFNLNLLHRINRELGGDLPIEAFVHRAVWNERLGRIEMHLVARRNIAFQAAGHYFHMAAGETIHTENSYKYTIEEARLLARASGWEPQAVWVDKDQLFSVHLWHRLSQRFEP